MTDLIRETHNVNARALELGAEPPVCVTWEVRSGHADHTVVSRPAQSVDHLRMAAFLRLMYEVSQT